MYFLISIFFIKRKKENKVTYNGIRLAKSSGATTFKHTLVSQQYNGSQIKISRGGYAFRLK